MGETSFYLITFRLLQSAVGFELWSMSGDILFDNLVISDDLEAVREWAAKTFDLKQKQIDKQAVSIPL